MGKRLAVLCVSGQMQCRRGTAVDADFTVGAVATQMTAQGTRTAGARWSQCVDYTAASQVTVTWLSRSRGQSASHERSRWHDILAASCSSFAAFTALHTQHNTLLGAVHTCDRPRTDRAQTAPVWMSGRLSSHRHSRHDKTVVSVSCLV